MTKFSTRDCAGYVAVSTELWRWANELREVSSSPSVQRGNWHSVNAASTTRQSVPAPALRNQATFSGQNNTGGGAIWQGVVEAGDGGFNLRM